MGIAFTVMCFSACVTHRHTATGMARAPSKPDDVRIFLEPLHVPFVAIGEVEASSRWSWSLSADAKTDVVIKRLQREAASLGANGILLQDISGDDHAAGAGVGTDWTRDHGAIGVFLFGPGPTRVGRGTAIVVAPQ